MRRYRVQSRRRPQKAASKASPIRVLHYAPGFLLGGIESCINSWAKVIPPTKADFSLLRQTEESTADLQEFERLGGKTHQVASTRPSSLLRHIIDVIRLFRKGKHFDIVHCHSYRTSIFVILAAKIFTHSRIIMHSHSSKDGLPRSMLELIASKSSIRLSNSLLAVSAEASEPFSRLVPSKGAQVSVIHNGVNISRFAENRAQAELIRKRLGLTKHQAFLFIGRFTEAKNLPFLVEVFASIRRRAPQSRLLLVGEGPEWSHVESLINEKGLRDATTFLGYQKRVEDFLHAADLLLLPSHYEGYPTVIVEAQVAGIPSIISENVTNEVVHTRLVKRAYLSDGPDEWAQLALNFSHAARKDPRSMDVHTQLSEQTSANRILQIYEEITTS